MIRLRASAPARQVIGVWWLALGALFLAERFGVTVAIGGACILLSAAVILRQDAAV